MLQAPSRPGAVVVLALRQRGLLQPQGLSLGGGVGWGWCSTLSEAAGAVRVSVDVWQHLTDAASSVSLKSASPSGTLGVHVRKGLTRLLGGQPSPSVGNQAPVLVPPDLGAFNGTPFLFLPAHPAILATLASERKADCLPAISVSLQSLFMPECLHNIHISHLLLLV